MTIIQNITTFGRVNLNGASTSAASSSQSSLPTNFRPPSADTFAGSNQASTSRLDNEQLNQSSSGQQTSATEEVNGRSGSKLRRFLSWLKSRVSAQQQPLIYIQMEHALNAWVQNGQESENRSEAKKRILRCFESRTPTLNLSELELKSLPEEIGNLTQLTSLSLESNQLTNLPQTIDNLTLLTSLSLRNNQLTNLPQTIGNLTQLNSLYLRNNQLTNLPQTIGNLTQLTFLDLGSNQLTNLPQTIGNLTQLTSLYLNNNQLANLPQTIDNLTQLTMLVLRSNQLTNLPQTIGNLTQLSWLNLSNNQLTNLPQTIGNLTQLRWLYLESNQLTNLPQSIFRLPRTTDINLEHNRLSQQTMTDLVGRTTGPQIHFSSVEAPAVQAVAGSSQEASHEVVREYCPNIAPDRLENLQNTENSGTFFRLLRRLARTAEARFSGFRERVAEVIDTLAEDGSADLRTQCYLRAHDGLDSCSDRVAITFDDIEERCMVHRVLRAGGDDRQVVNLLRGLFRKEKLDEYARQDIATRRGVDEIEVFLAYRVGLKDELHLPGRTGAMLYQVISGVTPKKLDLARAYVLNAENENDGAAMVEFALQKPFWKDYVEEKESFQQEKERIDEVSQARLEELKPDEMSSADYLSAVNQITAGREAQLQDLLRGIGINVFSINPG